MTVKPSEGDIRNHWWYPVGTKLKAHSDWLRAPLHEGHVYEVITEPHFAQVDDQDWTVRVRDVATGDEFDCLVVRLLRVAV